MIWSEYLFYLFIKHEVVSLVGTWGQTFLAPRHVQNAGPKFAIKMNRLISLQITDNWLGILNSVGILQLHVVFRLMTENLFWDVGQFIKDWMINRWTISSSKFHLAVNSPSSVHTHHISSWILFIDCINAIHVDANQSPSNMHRWEMTEYWVCNVCTKLTWIALSWKN